jgi:methionyl-tRNA synthetase
MSATAFVSTTIPYVNARPHLGHAFEYLQADAFARHMAMRGRDVYFLSGSDENSLKNVLAAEKEGITARELVDRNVTYFEQLIDALGLDLSGFVRTSSDPDHLAGATEIWRRMDEKGDIYAKDYEGLYCVGCEQFYSPSELIDGKCPEHNVPPEVISEHNYFFRLSRYADQLVEALESGRLRVVPETRLNETLGFIRSGLADISISRSTDRARGWGIPVPGDDGQVMYVWIDALTNYINALGWTHGDERYKRYWEAADKRTHVLGKGVLRFHAVYWPAMLLSAGLPLPTEVVVHGYITNLGQKLSKSTGNVVEPMGLVDRFGQDAVRYYLLADFSPFGDGDFSEERLASRYNTDLANGLGNLVSRVTSMTVRYRDGVTPPVRVTEEPERQVTELREAVAREAAEAMDRYDHRQALARIWDLVRRVNAYVDERAPWHLAKAADGGDEAAGQLLDTVLRTVLEAVRDLGILLRPYVPAASARILEAIGEPADASADALADLTGRTLAKSPPLFPRLES